MKRYWSLHQDRLLGLSVAVATGNRMKRYWSSEEGMGHPPGHHVATGNRMKRYWSSGVCRRARDDTARRNRQQDEEVLELRGPVDHDLPSARRNRQQDEEVLEPVQVAPAGLP